MFTKEKALALLCLGFFFLGFAGCNNNPNNSDISVKSNPLGLERLIVGEWKNVQSGSHPDTMIVHPLSNGGLFLYLEKEGFTGYISQSRDTLVLHKGCFRTDHRIKYLAGSDQIIVDDSIKMDFIPFEKRQYRKRK